MERRSARSRQNEEEKKKERREGWKGVQERGRVRRKGGRDGKECKSEAE